MGLARIFKLQRIIEVLLGQLAYNITTMTEIKTTPFHTRNPIAGRIHTTPFPPSAQKVTVKTDHSILETEQCTFEPKINHQNSSKRSLEKFLNDQERYQRSREKKLQQRRQQRREEEKVEVTLSPHIDAGSRRMASRQNSTSSIFERLATVVPKRLQTGYSFSPQILNRSQSIKRNTDISSLLYEDARRRQEKSFFMAETERSISERNIQSPKINSNASKLAARKILAEFSSIVTEEEVTPLVAVLALEDLFGVDLNPARQGDLLKSLLGHLSQTNADHVQVVKTSILKEFVGIVVGAEEPCQNFTPSEQSAIFNQFRHFYKERLCKDRPQATPQPLNFHPQTLPSSNKLAQCHRERACQKVQEFLQGNQVSLSLREGEITIEQLFILEGMRRQQQNARKREEKQRKQLQECTFRPNITPLASLQKSKKENPKPKITLKPIKKNSIPIQNPPKPSSKQKKQKQNKEPIYLPPRSDKKMQRNSISHNHDNSMRDMQKIMLRMAAGRQKREFSNTITERGYPKGENWTQLQKNMHRKSVQNLQKMRRLSFKS